MRAGKVHQFLLLSGSLPQSQENNNQIVYQIHERNCHHEKVSCNDNYYYGYFPELNEHRCGS